MKFRANSHADSKRRRWSCNKVFLTASLSIGQLVRNLIFSIEHFSVAVDIKMQISVSTLFWVAVFYSILRFQRNQWLDIPLNLLSIKSVAVCTGKTKFPPPMTAALCSSSLWQENSVISIRNILYESHQVG